MERLEIQKYFDLCEFEGECDFCDAPVGASFVQMGMYEEVDFYICEKCAPKEIAEIISEKRYYQGLDAR